MRPLVWVFSTLPLVYLVACGGGNNKQHQEQQQNPAPAIQVLTPASAPAGSADLTLQINGSGFLSSSTVQWGGAAKTCSFVSSAALSCTVTAGDLSVPGTANVSVTNPAPGGGTAAANFVIDAPNVPTLSSITPASIVPGSSRFTLTANGSGFTRNSAVLWNGSSRQTTYVSNLQLTAQIDTSDVASGGSYPVSISTPSPGGGTSQPINANVQYPLPAISSLSPSGAIIHGPGLSLTIIGQNFYPGAIVSWNHVSRVTTFVSATQLTASILNDDLNVALGTTADIYVTNPSPSAGISNTVQFALENPVPTISAITPDSGLAGDYTTVQITGANFLQGATVQANGQIWYTQVNSSTNLQASVQTSKVGLVAITVTNPAPNAGPSIPVDFESKAAGNPMNPQIVTIDPDGKVISASLGGASGTGRYVSFFDSVSFYNYVRDTCIGITSGCTPSTLGLLVGPRSLTPPPTWNVYPTNPSDDGRFVAFLTFDYFSKTFGIADLCTGVANCSPSVTYSPASDKHLATSSLSSSGRYVPFSTSNGVDYVQSASGIYDFCSNASPGCAPSVIGQGDFALLPVISGDARYAVSRVADMSSGYRASWGFALRDTCIGAAPGCVPTTTFLLDPKTSNCFDVGVCIGGIAISRNGAYASYLYDGEILVVSTCTQSVQGCLTEPLSAISTEAGLGLVSLGLVSDSGRYVTYIKRAPSGNLDTGFISDTCIGAPAGCQPQTAYACLNTEGALANGSCYLAGMSEDGKYIYYSSSATNLPAGPGGYAVANPLQ